MQTASSPWPTTSTLDYETTPSYTLTVQIRDGRKELSTNAGANAVDNTKTLTVTVTNIQEPGTLSLSTNHPQVDSEITATLADPDRGIESITWKWRSYDAQQNTWTTIDNQTTSSYTPTTSAAGKSLEASASYTDAETAGQYAAAVTPNVVSDATAALAFPRAEYRFPLLENLPTTYQIGQVQAGPGAATYSITAQPQGNHFTVTNTGIIKTTKIWDHESTTDRGPHSLTITATRTSGHNHRHHPGLNHPGQPVGTR